MSTDLIDLDDFDDIDFDDEEDEFADLDEFAEPEASPNLVDLNKPLCLTCGFGEAISGATKRSKCQRCGQPWAWDQITETAPVVHKKSGPPRPIMSGHCGTPQSDDPQLSHDRCAHKGAGSRANPRKDFHPCPCTCHLAHAETGEVLTYECSGCGGVLAEAPVFGIDEDGDPVYVHVDKHTSQMLYSGPCR